jgi:site-specific DNA-methyltransferase (cytosine-N4-specific)
LEASLTGSREYTQDGKRRWQEALMFNRSDLPSRIFEYCLSLQKSLTKTDGFRRQSVPSLIYRYLSDMRDVFREVLAVMKRSAPFALIVGHNRTTLGGRSFIIDTPDLLREIALACGWRHEESLPLETYQRYGSHMANSVTAETLLIVRKP